MKKKLSVGLILIALIYSCKNDHTLKGHNEAILKETTIQNKTDCPTHLLKSKTNNLNVSILLDLSDRIEESKAIDKDLAYISSLAHAFTNHVKTKKLVMLEDRMQLFFNPEPVSGEINEIAKSLKIHFTRNTPQNILKKTEILYTSEPSKLYNLAREDAKGNKQNYPGSDIWRFFKDNVRDYSIDNCHRNILVILTDGYMYYEKTQMKEGNRTSYLTPKSLTNLNLKKSSWKEEMQSKDLGFIPANQNLKDLEVLVLGINSLNDENPYAQDIIEAYWSKWFDEMGIPEENYKIKQAVIPSNMERVINDFINK